MIKPHRFSIGPADAEMTLVEAWLNDLDSVAR